MDDDDLWEELRRAEELLESNLSSDTARAKVMLKRIMEEHPNTSQAEQAKMLLTFRNIQGYGCAFAILVAVVVVVIFIVSLFTL